MPAFAGSRAGVTYVAMKRSSVVHSDPDILGGTPVFVGTRVPVQALIDYLEGGHALEEFLDDFPTVSRDLVIGARRGGVGSRSRRTIESAPR